MIGSYSKFTSNFFTHTTAHPTKASFEKVYEETFEKDNSDVEIDSDSDDEEDLFNFFKPQFLIFFKKVLLQCIKFAFEENFESDQIFNYLQKKK